MNEKELIKRIIRQEGLTSVKIAIEYITEVIQYEIPESEEEIQGMDEEEMRVAIQKINTLGSVFSEPVDPETLDSLHKQTFSLWGDPPQTTVGEWAEWCLWHHKRRYKQNGLMSESSDHQTSPEEPGKGVQAYLQDRTELWKRRMAESSDEYDNPEDVPDRLRDMILSPVYSN